MEHNYNSDTFATLRNVNLSDKGTIDGVTFVRCIPVHAGQRQRRDLTQADRLAIVCKAVAEIAHPGVVLANNPAHGGDYLRVDVRSPVFNLICQMKS